MGLVLQGWGANKDKEAKTVVYFSVYSCWFELCDI